MLFYNVEDKSTYIPQCTQSMVMRQNVDTF